MQMFEYCDPSLTIPCNPQNITELFGRKFKDFPVADLSPTVEIGNRFEEQDNLLSNLSLECPVQCTTQTYDVEHHTMKIPER